MSEFSEFEQRVWASVERVDKKMDALSGQMSTLRESQIRMEAADHSGMYERLESKMLKLEAKVITLEASAITSAAKQSGVAIALEWAYKLGPWLAITIIAVKNGLVGGP